MPFKCLSTHCLDSWAGGRVDNGGTKGHGVGGNEGCNETTRGRFGLDTLRFV